MNRSTSALLAAIAAAVSFAGPASAEDPPMGAPPAPPAAPAPAHGRFFDTYDANQDGKVTREEYMAGPGADEVVFALYDQDKDGTICLAELGLPPDYKPKKIERDRDDPMPDARAANGAERRA